MNLQALTPVDTRAIRMQQFSQSKAQTGKFLRGVLP
jgi:hypothetical protein